MKLWKIGVAALMVAVVALGQSPPPQDKLLSRVREGDRHQIQALLRSGADPNARDEAGATPLMHAAAFASPEIVRLLLDAGADPSLTNRSGSTALMWGTHDTETVRLLLRSGADVNAARPDGVTPLITAALRGNIDAVRFLLESGADPRKGTVLAPFPMTLSGIAYTTNDAGLRQLLLAKGVTPLRPEAAAGPTGAATPPPLTAWLLTSTFSWRPQPADTSKDLVNALLDAGANPNETVSQLTLTASTLARVLRSGDVESVRVLLERGADPNAKGSSGWTPLMAATLSENSAATVKALLDKGARVDTQDDAGRTALDWALAKGESETTRLLRDAGAMETAPPFDLPRAVSQARPARVAVERALSRLQPAVKGFTEKARCISCHNDSLPSVAMKLASVKGVHVDPTIAKMPTTATLKLWDQARENLLVGNCSVFGYIQNVSYGMLALAEEGVGQSSTTDAVTLCLSGLQKPDGSWEGNDGRPPLSGRSSFVYTALAARALKTYAPQGRSADTTARVARARDFLRKTPAEGTQNEVFKLLGLIWTGAPPMKIAAQSKRLQALQRENGGWGQYAGMSPDAYATGQALYALHASGLAVTSSIYKKGTQFLLTTQGEDGTWYMKSRAMGFQPYIEAGFPHGADQFISSAATAWAVIALAYTL